MRDLSLPEDFADLVESKRPAQDPHRYRICEICGQRFDTVNLDQTYHHGPEAHEPLAE